MASATKPKAKPKKPRTLKLCQDDISAIVSQVFSLLKPMVAPAPQQEEPIEDEAPAPVKPKRGRPKKIPPSQEKPATPEQLNPFLINDKNPRVQNADGKFACRSGPWEPVAPGNRLHEDARDILKAHQKEIKVDRLLLATAERTPRREPALPDVAVQCSRCPRVDMVPQALANAKIAGETSTYVCSKCVHNSNRE